MTPRVVELFFGARGFSLRFRAVGCEIQAAVDMDGAASKIFRQNFAALQPGSPPEVLAGDNANLEQVRRPWELIVPPPDILIGRPPRPAFSVIGGAKLRGAPVSC